MLTSECLKFDERPNDVHKGDKIHEACPPSVESVDVEAGLGTCQFKVMGDLGEE